MPRRMRWPAGADGRCVTRASLRLSSIEAAVDAVIVAGLRTPDIAGTGTTVVNTTEMGDAVAARVLVS